jgi:hypothetical protein
MAAIPSKNVPLVIGTCPSCHEVLVAVVDLQPEALARPVVGKPTAPATEDRDPWASREATVDITVRLTGVSLSHRCGSREHTGEG